MEEKSHLTESTINYTRKNYEIGLLWKNNNVHRPERTFMVFQRVKCVEIKCCQNEHFEKEYCRNANQNTNKQTFSVFPLFLFRGLNYGRTASRLSHTIGDELNITSIKYFIDPIQNMSGIG